MIVCFYFFSFSRSRISVRSTSSFVGSGAGAAAASSASFFLRRADALAMAFTMKKRPMSDVVQMDFS